MNKYLKYLTGGVYRPKFFPAGEHHRNEAVVLVHGLLHRSWVMLGLARSLVRHGYTVYVYDYPTTRGSIESHGAALREWLRGLAGRLPEGMKLHLVAHSMGGLVTRFALGDGAAVPPERRGRVILLAVPHGGSPVASEWVRRLPHLSRLLVRPLPQLCEEPEAVPELPFPEGWEIGSVIGRYDRKVPERSSRYPVGEFQTAECGHAFIMDNATVRKWIRNFLKSGKFCE